MKALAALFSVLLGVAVLVLFLRPWEQAPAPEAGTAPAVQPQTKLRPAPPSDPPKPQAMQAPDSEDPAMLARERADAKRSAALGGPAKHAIAPKAETKRYFKVRVRDAGTLEVNLPNAGPLLVRIAGIEARGPDEDCPRGDGTSWPCGAKAKSALTLFIRSRAVTCTLPPGGETDEFSARCSVMNQDLATWLVRRGWATPTANAGPALAEALKAAQAEEIGLWESE